METSKKAKKKKKKKSAKEKREKRNSNSGIPATGVNTINRARLKTKKDIFGIVYQNCNRKDYISQNYIES